MKNFIQDGKRIEYLNSSGTDIQPGTVIVIGSLIGCALSLIAAGDSGTVLLEGVFALAKATPLAIAQGDEVFFNTSTNKITKTATDIPIGVAFAAALSADTAVKVRLFYGSSDGKIAADVPAIKPTTNLPATAGVYADLAAARTDVAALNAAVELRFDAIETKIDAITASLRASGLMA